MILSSAQMLHAEALAFSHGHSPEELMELAGIQMARFVQQFHPTPGMCRVFFGKGHNGGDVLVAARHLALVGWHIILNDLFPSSDLAPLTALQLSRLPEQSPTSRSRPLVVLDGILGIGTRGDPRPPVAQAIDRIRALRTQEGAWVLSADLPSGLTETGPANPCVMADATITTGFAKSFLLSDSATNFVGRLSVAALPPLVAPPDADSAEILSAESLRHILPPRPFDMHKGMCGRVGIIAGSRHFPGAARLCSAAAVKSGAGLVTLFVPLDVAPLLATSAIPEVMISPISNFRELIAEPFHSFAIGPGISRERDEMVREFIIHCPTPCVVDADALNAISGHTHLLKECAGPRLLTPHPLEMERLAPRHGQTRREWVSRFTSDFPVTLLLKGSRTIIAENASPLAFNTTGHPGMASGGMGDVLTGVCAAMIAQGKSPIESAIIGAWICGYSAESALRSGQSQESLTASDVISHLGEAFEALRSGAL